MIHALTDRPHLVVPARADAATAALAAAGLLLPHLERGRRIDASTLRGVMETTFGGSDAAGAWDWKAAYDACEAATVLFLRRYGPGAAPPCADAGGDAASDRPDQRRFFRPTRGGRSRARPCSSSAHRSALAWLLPRRRGEDRAEGRVAGAVGRDWAPHHLRRARRRRPRAQRTGRDPRRDPGRSFAGHYVVPARRGADP